MADIFIEEFKDVKFTRNQKKIASYFAEHSYDIVRMNLSETAAAAGVSEVSILNFVRKLGYKGFVDFKARVVDRLEQNANTIILADDNGLSARMNRNLQGREDRSLLENHLLVTMSVTENSLLQNSTKAYSDAVELIINAEKTYVTGARSMLGIAARFGSGLSYLTDNVHLLQNDVLSVIQYISHGSEKDTLLLVCFSRFYSFDERICQAARDAGIKIILLTDTSVSPISKYADVLLVADSTSSSFFNSTNGAVAILEYLLALIADNKGDSLTKLLDVGDGYTEDYRIK